MTAHDQVDEKVDEKDEKTSAHRGVRVAVLYAVLVLVPAAGAAAFLAATNGGTPAGGSHGLASASGSLARFLLAMAVIVAGAKLAGMLARRLGQPAVIGEILLGIVLGPSVIGAFWPAGLHWLIPHSVLPQLNVVAEIGVVLFIFLVGAELDTGMLRGERSLALTVSHVGVAVPFVAGIAIAIAGYSLLAPPGLRLVPFALFVGETLSITALPVLARILMDTDLYGTQVGTFSLTCAMISDVTAWCLLGLVIALATSGTANGFFVTLALVAAFIAVLFLLVKPLMRRIATAGIGRFGNGAIVPAALIGLLLSALATQWIGVNSIFGAFLFGLILPADTPWVRRLRDIVGPVTTVLLLPLFFVYSGLRTDIGLLGFNPVTWLWTGLIIVAAVAGKFGGSTVAARAGGKSWYRSIQIGALMNTRGLTELIVLNVGLDLGLLSKKLFTMLVVMALVATVMTGPILARLRSRAGGRLEELDDVASGVQD